MHTYRVMVMGAAMLIVGCGTVVNVAQDTQGQGGAAAGGMSAGGMSGGGQGGTVSVGGGGNDRAAPWCNTASDCTMLNDCCSCMGLHTSEGLLSCPTICDEGTCNTMNAPTEPSCVAGRCVAGFSCSGPVLCLMPPPDCEPGHVPRVADGCYQGCVLTQQCQAVDSCDVCAPNNLCVVEPDKVPSVAHHCVPTPATCEGQPLNCECAGTMVCDSDETCVDQGAGRVACIAS